MIVRTYDAGFLNHVANDPDVRPWLGAGPDGSLDSEVDLGPILESGVAYALIEPGCGGFLIVRTGDCEFECHTMFLPDRRGQIAFQAACEALDHIFSFTSCRVLHTQLPNGNRGAKELAAGVGFKRGPDRQSAWRASGGAGEDWYITAEMWAQRRADLIRSKMLRPF